MASFDVRTSQAAYSCVVERGILKRAADFLPAKSGKGFIVTSEDVWRLQGQRLDSPLAQNSTLLFLPPGEPNKRLSSVENLAGQMVAAGADRTSVVIGFGGGIVTDLAGFLAAIFMRGIPVLQIPTTLLAQVDAAVGGKTGVNLVSGKNLIGSFHQPCAVLIDPETLGTLPERELRAGLFEVVKCAIIRDPHLFEVLETETEAVLALRPAVLDCLIAASVRIKAEVVSADEREGGLRRILNFGHTVGHALEAETEYRQFLHGEAVAWGMLAAIRLAELAAYLPSPEADRMRSLIRRYGPIPSAAAVAPEHLIDRLQSDKKTLRGKIHFVLPIRIGEVKVISDIEPALVRQAITESFQ